jgi:uncharacterized protein (DUF427 family)
MKAIWKNTVIAESDDIVSVEGNAYFPRAALDDSMIESSTTTSVCSWKGTAHYYSVVVGPDRNLDAVWYYPEPKEAAAAIKDRVAFWRGVEITD